MKRGLEIGNKIDLIGLAKQSVRWDDMSEFVYNVSKTLYVCSWGAEKWKNFSSYILSCRVNAHRHKGNIYWAVNGSDLFNVYLTTSQGRILHIFKNAHIEDVLSLIDEKIEYIPEYNQ